VPALKLVPRGAEASDKAADRGGAASGILRPAAPNSTDREGYPLLLSGLGSAPHRPSPIASTALVDFVGAEFVSVATALLTKRFRSGLDPSSTTAAAGPSD
jgi:hypothetical protein